MFKKLKKILIPQVEGKQRWWHRFVNVLIYGSTVFLFIFFVGLFVGEKTWEVSHGYIYSFEEGYHGAKGREESCYFSSGIISTGRLPFLPPTRCGSISNTSELLDRISRAEGSYESLVELRESADSLARTQAQQQTGYIPLEQRVLSSEEVDEQIVKTYIEQGAFDDIKEQTN